MKRMITISFMLLLIPLSCSAISLEELQSNPEQYEKIIEAPSGTIYLELNSIKSLRNSPPYYTLQAKVYSVLYDTVAIAESTRFFNYDDNRSTLSLLNKIVEENSKRSFSEQNNMLLTELEKDCGMSYSDETVKYYKFNGEFAGTGTPLYSQKIKYNTNIAFVASCAFKQYYKHYF